MPGFAGSSSGHLSAARGRRAECAAQPVVIALEDLHGADLPTIKLIDAALSALSDQPLMVLSGRGRGVWGWWVMGNGASRYPHGAGKLSQLSPSGAKPP